MNTISYLVVQYFQRLCTSKVFHHALVAAVLLTKLDGYSICIHPKVSVEQAVKVGLLWEHLVLEPGSFIWFNVMSLKSEYYSSTQCKFILFQISLV